MNANQFIKDHGVDKAREVVEGAPSNAVYYWEIPRCTHGCYSTFERNQEPAIVLNELKRLVESVDIILELGGLRSAKANVREMYIDSSCDYVHPEVGLYDYKHLTVGRVKQAIADHEAIYSNDCEILDYPEDYTSPNCNKFDERVK